MASIGIVSGYPDGLFRPDDYNLLRSIPQYGYSPLNDSCHAGGWYSRDDYSRGYAVRVRKAVCLTWREL